MRPQILQKVREVREAFEVGVLDIDLLASLYKQYNQVPDVREFVVQGLEMFPHLNCGISSVYIRHILHKGSIVQGFYGNHKHTFLEMSDGHIIDITADQYGGPPVYVGPCQSPWSKR